MFLHSSFPTLKILLQSFQQALIAIRLILTNSIDRQGVVLHIRAEFGHLSKMTKNLLIQFTHFSMILLQCASLTDFLTQKWCVLLLVVDALDACNSFLSIAGRHLIKEGAFLSLNSTERLVNTPHITLADLDETAACQRKVTGADANSKSFEDDVTTIQFFMGTNLENKKLENISCLLKTHLMNSLWTFASNKPNI